MKQRILITAGPTNENIDEVMKITNMSTGRLGTELAHLFLCDGYEHEVTLIGNKNLAKSALFAKYGFIKNPWFKYVQIENTEDMYNALKDESKSRYDMVIHSAAVADYKPEFSFKMDDMSREIAQEVEKIITEELYGQDLPFKSEDIPERILKILTNPKCKVKSDTKISSYEPNLTVKLGLTTKIISNLRTWFPKASLIGFKLLNDVTPDHLQEVAQKLCNKNNMDFIIANDLSILRKGTHLSYLVPPKGKSNIEFHSSLDIYEVLSNILFSRKTSTPICGIYREFVNSQIGYEDIQFTGADMCIDGDVRYEFEYLSYNGGFQWFDSKEVSELLIIKKDHV